jgi:hypothetical protein
MRPNISAGPKETLRTEARLVVWCKKKLFGQRFDSHASTLKTMDLPFFAVLEDILNRNTY